MSAVRASEEWCVGIGDCVFVNGRCSQWPATVQRVSLPCHPFLVTLYTSSDALPTALWSLENKVRFVPNVPPRAQRDFNISTMVHIHHEIFTFSLKTGSPRSVVLGNSVDRRRTVRSRIMPDRVQVKLAPYNIIQIQLGSQDVLRFPRRSREYRPKRTDN